MPTHIQHTSVYLPKELHTALRIASLNRGLTMSELIVRSLEGTWNLTSQPTHYSPTNSQNVKHGDT